MRFSYTTIACTSCPPLRRRPPPTSRSSRWIPYRHLRRLPLERNKEKRRGNASVLISLWTSHSRWHSSNRVPLQAERRCPNSDEVTLMVGTGARQRVLNVTELMIRWVEVRTYARRDILDITNVCYLIPRIPTHATSSRNSFLILIFSYVFYTIWHIANPILTLVC